MQPKFHRLRRLLIGLAAGRVVFAAIVAGMIMVAGPALPPVRAGLAASGARIDAGPAGWPSGVVRLNLDAAGRAPTAEDTRFFVSSAPAVVLIAATSIFSLLAAFPFSSGLRGRRPWRRIASRLLGLRQDLKVKK